MLSLPSSSGRMLPLKPAFQKRSVTIAAAATFELHGLSALAAFENIAMSFPVGASGLRALLKPGPVCIALRGTLQEETGPKSCCVISRKCKNKSTWPYYCCILSNQQVFAALPPRHLVTPPFLWNWAHLGIHVVPGR